MRARIAASLLAATAVSVICAVDAGAASTPEQSCQRARYVAKASYDACEATALATKYLKIFTSSRDQSRFASATGKCLTKYANTWAKLQQKTGFAGTSCDNARYDTSIGGTVIDRLTGLQWEQKTDDDGIHDKDGFFSWSAEDDSPAADGTAHTTFLATLNGGPCFAGQCDWRLPTRSELLTVMANGYPCLSPSPCIDQGLFGPSDPIEVAYWSSTTDATDPLAAWYLHFSDGFAFAPAPKAFAFHVRAVRGGL